MSNEQISTNLGENIKEMRLRKNMTQSQLANKLGVSKQVISAYEKGKRMPSYDILFKLANIFSTTINDLILGTMDIIQISVNELTKSQIKIIMNMIDEFKRINKK